MNGATVKVYSLANDGTTALSTNFKVSEFKCQDGTDTVYVSPELVTLLQKVRDHFGAPVVISSAYRTEAHNVKVGGATYSKHKYGMAADIKVTGVDVLDVCKYVASITTTGGIGRYATFTHVDVRPTRYLFDCRSGSAKQVSSF